MGKKNFVENYDPLSAHLKRDLERSVARAEARPVPQESQVVAPPVVTVPAPVRPLVARESKVPSAPKSKAAVPRSVVGKERETSARIKVSTEAFQDLEETLARVYQATKTKVHYSIVTRAMWALVVQAEALIVEEVGKAKIGRLPSTRDGVAYAEFEDRVRQALSNAFRRLSRTNFQPASVDADATEE